jgi:glucosamine-6-phosphate deaminase
MEIIIHPTAAGATAIAARMVASLLRVKPDAVLGLATGSTPVALYQELMEMGLDWSRVTTFNLDEYIGLPRNHPQSYHRFMWENLFRHVNIRPERVHIPDGNAADVPATCQDYENRIADAGGIDLQILGIGTDGHIGFNEPTSSLASRTRIKTLTRRTREDNARFFGSVEEVPHHVITMGIGTIMEARECFLLAFGDSKARVIAETVEGDLTASNPASILQMHPSAKVFLDALAAAHLSRKDYYQWVYDNKPDWQRTPVC